MAVEDFVLFKQMMVNRNIQMNKQAMKQMEAKGKTTSKIAQAVQNQESSSEEESEDEEEMMRKAIEASEQSAKAEEE